MASLEELRAERVKKLKVLKEKGINPYPIFSAREYEIAEVIVKFKTFEKRKNLSRSPGALLLCVRRVRSYF